MNGKVVAIILAAAVAVGGAAMMMTRRTEESVRAETVEGLLLPEIAADAERIAEVHLRGAAGELTLRRKDGGWVIPERFSYPADKSKLRTLLVALSEMRRVEAKTASPALHDRLGVGEPAAGNATVIVQLRDDAGATIAGIHLGNAEQGPGTTRQYVRKAGDAQSWLVDRHAAVLTGFTDWVDSALVNVQRTRARRVSISHQDGEQVLISRGSAEETAFTLETLPENRELGNPGMLNDLGNSFLSNTFTDVKPLESLNRDETARLSTVVMETFDGLRLKAELFTDEQDGIWVVYSAEELPVEPAGEDAAPASAAEEIAAINAKAVAWAFQLPTWQTDRMKRRNGYYLKPLEDLIPNLNPTPEMIEEELQEVAPPTEEGTGSDTLPPADETPVDPTAEE